MRKELKTICEELVVFLGVDDVADIGEKLRDIVFNTEKEKIYDKYVELVGGDVETDWIQKIYQYYKSNRADFKQDYTPQSMSKCLAEMVYWKGAKTAYDACSGSGSLVIELHKIDNNLQFVCEEFDDNVIPFLLFNLSIRNINAVVIRGDIINQEQYDFYRLTPGDKYSNIEKIDEYKMETFDIVTSNPPFNLKDFRSVRKFKSGIKIGGSSNTYFALHGIEALNDKGRFGLILPTGFISSTKTDDTEARKYMVENNLLEAVVCCPGDFFESTGTNTSILYINKQKKDDKTVLIDCTTEGHSEWIREQRGQFGGACHTNRVYKKIFKCFSDNDIDLILSTIRHRMEKNEFSAVLSNRRFHCDYTYMPGRYFEINVFKPDITQEEWERFIQQYTDELLDYNARLQEFKMKLLNLLMSGVIVLPDDYELEDEEQDGDWINRVNNSLSRCVVDYSDTE